MSDHCREFRSRIADFVTGVLSEQEQQELQEHLRTCLPCRDHMQALKQEDDSLAAHFAGIDEDMAQRQERALQMIECFHANERTNPASIWRKTMRSRYSKLATAAAILVLASVSVVILDKSTSSAYALDQPVQALQSVRHVHLIERDDTGVIRSERWIEIGEDGRQSRYRQDKPPHLFVIDDGNSIARYHPGAKAVTFPDRSAMRYEWISNIGRAFENARDEGMILEENAAYHGRRVHKVWGPTMRDVGYGDPATKLPIAIGNAELTYEQPPAGTFDIATPGGPFDGYTVVKDVNESGFYASVELIQPNEHLAEIVNASDVIRLHRTGSDTYEGDLDIQIRCKTDISWGLSGAPTGEIRGVYASSVNRFDIASPGGVATVGLKLTSATVAEPPRNHKLATVRLLVEARPAPMDDAGALRTLGLALYDAKRDEDALATFQKAERAANADQECRAGAVIWQGHMLDLLGRRTEAIAKYETVVKMGLDGGVRHDQYGLSYEYTPYATERMITPFNRVERKF